MGTPFQPYQGPTLLRQHFPSLGTAGFGYTTSDTTLGTGTVGRFGSNSWAGLSSTGSEVAFGPALTLGDTNCVAYRVGISTTTPAATYSATVVYSAVPTF